MATKNVAFFSLLFFCSFSQRRHIIFFLLFLLLDILLLPFTINQILVSSIRVLPSSSNVGFSTLSPSSMHRFRTSPLRRQRGQIYAMFTGIVEEMGRVIEIQRKKKIRLWNNQFSEGMEVTIKAKKTVKGANIGCSIAVNGVCLSVTNFGPKSRWKQQTKAEEEEKEEKGGGRRNEEMKGKEEESDMNDDDDFFTVGISPETLRKTNLNDLKIGELVNLERSLAADGRNSGHFVQGHVDGRGKIIEKWREGDSLWFKISVEDELLSLIVKKGFISLEGVSLTVCDVYLKEKWFTLMIIPITQKTVNLPFKEIGSSINVEVDVLGKYVQRALQGVLETKLEEIEEKVKNIQKTKVDRIDE